MLFFSTRLRYTFFFMEKNSMNILVLNGSPKQEANTHSPDKSADGRRNCLKSP